MGLNLIYFYLKAMVKILMLLNELKLIIMENIVMVMANSQNNINFTKISWILHFI